MINPNQKHQVYSIPQPRNAWSPCKKENEILEYVNEYPNIKYMMSDMKGWAVKCIVNLQNTCAYIISTY